MTQPEGGGYHVNFDMKSRRICIYVFFFGEQTNLQIQVSIKYAIKNTTKN